MKLHGYLPHASFQKSVQSQLITQGFLFLICQKRTGILEASPFATTRWASIQCEWPDEHAFWRQETLALVLDPSSEGNDKISVSRISHLSNEATILAFQD